MILGHFYGGRHAMALKRPKRMSIRRTSCSFYANIKMVPKHIQMKPHLHQLIETYTAFTKNAARSSKHNEKVMLTYLLALCLKVQRFSPSGSVLGRCSAFTSVGHRSFAFHEASPCHLTFFFIAVVLLSQFFNAVQFHWSRRHDGSSRKSTFEEPKDWINSMWQSGQKVIPTEEYVFLF